MANNKVSILITARDTATAVLKKVTGAARSAAGAIGSAFKSMAQGAAIGAGFAVMTAALRGFNSAIRKTGSFILDTVKAFAESEQAIAGLEGALIGLGKSPAQIDALTKSFGRLASQIQKETGVSDEATLSMITQLMQLGVLENQMEQAARAVVALKSVGMEQQAAMKAVSMAIQGNYSMLQRYVPALRDAKSETEKASIVNKLFSATYEQQQKQLNTVAGGWTAFKENVGDAMELIGGAIVRGLRLGETLAGLNEKLRNIGDSPKFQAFLARVQSGTTYIRELVTALASGKEGFTETGAALGGVLKAAIVDGASFAGSYLLALAPLLGEAIGTAFKNAAKDIGKEAGQQSVALDVARQQGLINGFQQKLPFMLQGTFSDEAKQFIEQFKKDLNSDGVEDAGDILAKSIKDGGKNTQAALENLNAVIGKFKGPSGGGSAGGAGNAAGGAGGAVAAPIKFDVVKPEELPDMAGPLKEQIAGLQDQEAEWKKIGDALDENIEKVEKQIEQNKELAGMRVADFLAQKKKNDEDAKAKEEEAKKIDRLKEKEKRRIKLNKEDKAFLEGAKAIEAAKKLADDQQNALLIMKGDAAVAKENADKANKAVADGFNDLNGMLKQLLVAPEG
jgi:hypothetical protein